MNMENELQTQPLIDEDFYKSGMYFNFLNNLADVRDREIRRKCDLQRNKEPDPNWRR